MGDDHEDYYSQKNALVTYHTMEFNTWFQRTDDEMSIHETLTIVSDTTWGIDCETPEDLYRAGDDLSVVNQDGRRRSAPSLSGGLR